MASKPIRMEKIRLIFQKKEKGISIRQIAKDLKVSRNTVKSYLKIGQQNATNPNKILEKTDEELHLFFKKHKYKKRKENIKDELFLSQIETYETRLKNERHLTKTLLWEEYIEKNPQGYSYSQFSKLLRIRSKRKDLSYTKFHLPGHVMEVDYAGKKLGYWDAKGKFFTECEVFMTILPASNLIYCQATRSQKQEDTLQAIGEAMEYYGGVPQNILSDNLKAMVKRSHRYEPSFTHAAEQFSLHYKTNLDATRAYKPKDKAKVEGAVKICYQRIYAKVEQQKYYSFEALNDAILEELEALNNRKMKEYGASRWELFDRLEKNKLDDLPKSKFYLTKSNVAKVQKNYHVFLSEDAHYYSVPYQYVGSKVKINYTNDQVEIYTQKDFKRIAFHKRLRQKKGYSTHESHLPENHRITFEIQGWTADSFLEKAQKIGPNCTLCLEKMMASRNHPQQAFKACLGVLRLGKSYSNIRLEKACSMVIAHQLMPSYKTLDNILFKKTDLQSLTLTTDNQPFIIHKNVRCQYH